MDSPPASSAASSSLISVLFSSSPGSMVALLSASLRNEPRFSSPSGERCKYSGQSVRAIPIRILTVGRKRSHGVQLVVDEYIGKLKLYCIVEDVQVRSNPRNARDPRAQVDDEDRAVMNHIKSTDWVVMLDERGEELGSEKMAELVGDAGNLGAWNRLIFCIGGAYGHGQQLRERANTTVKLSSMVLNHQIALLVLMEQLYRRTLVMPEECVVYRLPQLRMLYTLSSVGRVDQVTAFNQKRSQKLSSSSCLFKGWVRL